MARKYGRRGKRPPRGRKHRRPLKRRKKRSARRVAVSRAECKIDKDILGGAELVAVNTWIGLGFGVAAGRNPTGSFLFSPFCNSQWAIGATTYGLVNSFLIPSQFSKEAASFNQTMAGHKCFLFNGSGSNRRIGRKVTMKSCRAELILQLIPNLVAGAANPVYANNPKVRVIHGWCRNGIHDYANKGLAEINGLYDEVDWCQYKVISDRIITRRVIAGVPTTAAAAGVGSYANINLNLSWNVAKRQICFGGQRAAGFEGTSVAGGDAPYVTAGQQGFLSVSPPEYSGWAPFCYILNADPNGCQLKVEHYKRVLTWYDV